MWISLLFFSPFVVFFHSWLCGWVLAALDHQSQPIHCVSTNGGFKSLQTAKTESWNKEGDYESSHNLSPSSTGRGHNAFVCTEKPVPLQLVQTLLQRPHFQEIENYGKDMTIKVNMKSKLALCFGNIHISGLLVHGIKKINLKKKSNI